MAGIYHQVGVKAEIKDVYTTLVTLEGLSGWWTKTTGNPETGGDLQFHFNDFVLHMTVQQLVPDKKVTWLCTEEDGEWKDTLISFELDKTDDQVFINFSHTVWAEQTSFCSHCSTTVGSVYAEP